MKPTEEQLTSYNMDENLSPNIIIDQKHYSFLFTYVFLRCAVKTKSLLISIEIFFVDSLMCEFVIVWVCVCERERERVM